MGIAADSNNPEWNAEMWRQAKPASELFSPEKFTQMAAVRKVPLTMRVDPDVMEALRGTGAGWQTRVNAVLRKAFVRQNPWRRFNGKGKT